MSKVYCDRFVTYWTPRFKYQVVDWLVSNRGYDSKWLNRMSKLQLYAIYHKIRGN